MINFSANDPLGLLNAFDAAIAANAIRTWEGKKGGPYMHTAERWKFKALFFPTVEAKGLRFRLICVEGNVPVSERRAVYSFYHGHLVETFMNHFSGRYSDSVLSAAPVSGETGF